MRTPAEGRTILNGSGMSASSLLVGRSDGERRAALKSEAKMQLVL